MVVRCACLEPDAGQTSHFLCLKFFHAFLQVICAFLFLLSAKTSKVLQPQNSIRNAKIIFEAKRAFFSGPTAFGADFSCGIA